MGFDGQFSPEVIADLGGATYQVTRRQRSKRVKGVAVQGLATTHDVFASVQPATGRDLMKLPEGRRSEETRVLYAIGDLQLGGQGASHESDRVSIDGETWEVQHIEKWPGYVRAIVQLIREKMAR